jgi:membrane-associated phospholipid phosphatase
MNYISLLYTLSFVMLVNALHGQNDSLNLPDIPPPQTMLFNAPGTKFILPAALITYGALTQVSPMLKQLDKYVNTTSPHSRVKIDEYMQYAPALSVYGLDFAGVKAKHNFRDRTFVMLSSHVFMALSVHATKLATHVVRPNGSGYNSFPSGHTATAFTGAHILFREYGEASPWISVAGYATATATGFLRIVNKKHWLSDVVTGAGVGILSVEAGYWLLPLFRRMMGEGRDMGIVPLVGNKMYGLGFACRF